MKLIKSGHNFAGQPAKGWIITAIFTAVNSHITILETILITGGSGLIGRHLSERLTEKGYKVSILTRNRPVKHDKFKFYFWDPGKDEIDNQAIETADYIIHLSGANIGEKRWTEKRKQEIISSRVKTAELILERVAERGKKVRAFISASATGYYGSVTSDRIFTEDDEPAADFLGEVCMKWEEAAVRSETMGIRSVRLRTGVVLTGRDGALGKLAGLTKSGLASPVGSGRQYLPWIHIDDLCNIYIRAIENEKMHGVYNATSPDHKTNREFMAILAHVLRRPYFMPAVPGFILRLLYGEMASVLLEGSMVSSEKLAGEGFVFMFPGLEAALRDLLLKKQH